MAVGTFPFKVFFEHKINILTEVSVISFRQFSDFFDYIFIQSDANFCF